MQQFEGDNLSIFSSLFVFLEWKTKFYSDLEFAGNWLCQMETYLLLRSHCHMSQPGSPPPVSTETSVCANPS